MGALLGLGVGVGLLLVLAALGDRPPTRAALGRLQGARAGARHRPAARRPDRVVAGLLATAAFVAVLTLTGVPVLAALFAGAAGLLPGARRAAAHRRVLRERMEAWPDAVDQIASAVRAGLGLSEALAALGARGPEPLRAPWARFAADYHSHGVLALALDRVQADLADPFGDRVIEGVRIAREVGGGDLGRLLRDLSGFLREEVRTRAELRARQAWTVQGARLAVAAPWLVLLLLSFQPEVIARYATPGGAIVLVLGAGLSWVAYLAMLRIGRLPTATRVLR